MAGMVKNDSCIGEELHCSICCEIKPKVFGNFSELKTYNLDKRGMIAGGFSTEQTSRNFPVCPECAATLALGINSATTLLSYKMAGQDFLLLPQCDDAGLRETFVSICEEGRKRDSLAEKDLNKITEDEAEILDDVAKQFGVSDRLSLKVVFYESKKNSWRIKAEINQVLPSRIQEIFEAKKLVERRSWNADGKTNVSMFLIREFAGGSFTNSKREFLGHIDAIFRGRSLDFKTVLRNIVDKILHTSKRDEKKAGYVIKRAWLIYDFYQQLSVIPTSKGRPMNTQMSEKSAYGKYLDTNAEFFGSSSKRIAFLTGALARQVMNAQKKKLESTPFAKKFKGMRITPPMLRKLLAQSKEKLRAYDVDELPSNRDLIELLCDQWVECKNDIDLSVDETTFYFTIGLTLNYHITQEFAKTIGEQDAPKD